MSRPLRDRSPAPDFHARCKEVRKAMPSPAAGGGRPVVESGGESLQPMQRRTAFLVALVVLIVAGFLLSRSAKLPPGLIPEDGAYDLLAVAWDADGPGESPGR